MKKLFAVSIFVLFGLMCGSTLQAQEHAPTAEVCHADANLWDNQADFMAYRAERRGFIVGKTATSPLGILAVKELEKREAEMTNCYESDGAKTVYFIVRDFYLGVLEDREVDFIGRHHLVSEFYREDAVGKR